ncbi:LuxR C-terminal-related transcriptional regulator [Krasilnikoviella flava]|uniref:LuxR family transcriptional regulator, maltose regulon positive regulatory protein n=1 Tax=Krasilnikoviella flava TaxID=526729 RepID=A0A1T5KSR1_9MICO|nr:LuxR C-terminal-related transcriptional regulator [Krasilnikoviella flava]SKC66683.1 LuxR family transcriptional regulator, maltose regulon positive regulatory protein [Krasilnikoviella flava]
MKSAHEPGAPDLDASTPGRRDLLSTVSQAKLRPAVNPGYLVPRPRLVGLLDDAVQAPLTLVVAPAGSGKTSLVRDWAARTTLPHAWLSVDEPDRDPAQLWRGILAALEGIAPGCSDTASRAIRQQRPLADALAVLLDDLEARAYDPRVLVVDNLELVDDEPVAASLRTFVQHLPRWLHVVLVSRRVPQLPVDRLRARGLLGEVRFTELRFSDEEASAMLSRLAPTMPADQVDETSRQAEGWAASIQLAALAARAAEARADDDRAAEDRAAEDRVAPDALRHDDGARYLEDYVWHEVLRGEASDVVEVLTDTAVIDRVAPHLAQVLADRDDAPDLLARAEERGLFVARIEPAGSYELHGLVRGALVARLRRQSPERVARLHRLAARWYEEDGQPVNALEHLLLAREHREALRLLASCVAALHESGRGSTVLRMLAAIPEDVALADPAAMTDLAWCRLYVDRANFVQTVDGLDARAHDAVPDVAGGGIEAPARARIEVLHAVVAAIRGDWAGGAGLARSGLATTGDSWPLDPVVRYGWNLVAREVALAERWDDASAEVRKLALTIAAAPERRLALEGTRALGAALGGHPVDALRLVAGTRKASDQAGMTMLRTELLTAEGIADREIGDRAAALPLLARLADADCDPLPHCRLLACLELTRTHLDQGDLDAAGRAFARATEIVDTDVTGPGGRSLLARTGCLVALARGGTDEARRWVAQIDDPFWSAVKGALVLVAEGEPGAVGDLLEDAEPRNPRHRVVRDLLLGRTAAGPAEAEEHLLRAVELASAHGLVQTVASAGPEVVEAIERLAWRVPPAWLARLRRVPVNGAALSNAAVRELTRSLTDRQLGILRMLPSRLTLREIADELYISVNTLKFHLKTIYRELGCGSRAEAAELARTLISRGRGHPSSTLRR